MVWGGSPGTTGYTKQGNQRTGKRHQQLLSAVTMAVGELPYVTIQAFSVHRRTPNLSQSEILSHTVRNKSPSFNQSAAN